MSTELVGEVSMLKLDTKDDLQVFTTGLTKDVAGLVEYNVPSANNILIGFAAAGADGVQVPSAPVLLVALANTRQWGNNVRIAPQACPDDGRLDLVIVEHGSTWVRCVRGWRIWRGVADRASGVVTRRFVEATISAAGDMPLHIDGEPAGVTREVRVRVLPRALAVKVPVGSVRARHLLRG
jgi:hypothetical protein